MTIISWNVNGLRAVIRKSLFLEFLKKYNPDVLCLQETKADRTQVEIDLPDYQEFWHSAKRPGYSGTAIFTKIMPVSAKNGFLSSLQKTAVLSDDQGRDVSEEGRVITMEFDNFFLVNVYTPNAKENLSRLNFKYRVWNPLFLQHLKALEKKKPVIFCGDINVAHTEIDLARPKENMGKHGFTKEEREGFSNLINAGFIDIYRDMHPNKTDAYTWWSHWGNARLRNVGWRIDYVCVSQKLKKKVVDAFILPGVMGSDHCPVGIDVKL